MASNVTLNSLAWISKDTELTAIFLNHCWLTLTETLLQPQCLIFVIPRLLIRMIFRHCLWFYVNIISLHFMQHIVTAQATGPLYYFAALVTPLQYCPVLETQSGSSFRPALISVCCKSNAIFICFQSNLFYYFGTHTVWHFTQCKHCSTFNSILISFKILY